ncbi:hypothetical protein E2320_006616 [Naja naja]|nr:hypothetical protein E2320_006616 [Naja naja]
MFLPVEHNQIRPSCISLVSLAQGGKKRHHNPSLSQEQCWFPACLLFLHNIPMMFTAEQKLQPVFPWSGSDALNSTPNSFFKPTLSRTGSADSEMM